MSDAVSADVTQRRALPQAAIAEILLFFAVALLVDQALLDGGRFREVQPHPFWLFLLVIAAHYGTAAGLLTAALATALALAGNLPPRDPLTSRSAYLFALSLQPLLWFASAIVLGELRNRHQRTVAALGARVRDLEAHNHTLAIDNQQLEDSNERLRSAAAGQVATTTSLVHAARGVETMEPRYVFSSVENLVSGLLRPSAYTIYLHHDDHLALVAQVTDGLHPPVAQTYGIEHPLYHAVVGERQVVHVASPEGQALLGRDGVLAGPLLDPEGTVVGMMKIEGLPIANLRPDTVQTFIGLCEWIGTAYRNALRFEDANRARALHPGSRLFTESFYTPIVSFVVALAGRARFEVSQLSVRVRATGTGGDDPAGAVASAIEDLVVGGLRSTDLAFDLLASRREYLIVLPMTPAGHCQTVADRVRERVAERIAERGVQGSVQVTYESLFIPAADDVKPWHRPILRRTDPYS